MKKVLLRESPCDSCSYAESCGVKCQKWNIWFSAEWRRIRRMFAELGFELEVKDDDA